jgi:hypothetical protein
MLNHTARREKHVEADQYSGGHCLSHLRSDDLPDGAGTRAVPEAEGLGRGECHGADSGEGCSGLTQGGSTLAWALFASREPS